MKTVPFSKQIIIGTNTERLNIVDDETLLLAAEFHETDTGNRYFWDGLTWGLIRKSNADTVNIVGGGLSGPSGNTGNGQVVAFTGTSAQSTAITATVIDLTATEDCFIAIALSPAAAANSDYFMPKNSTYRFPMTTGHKVAVIQATTGGNLYIHPVS